MAPAAGLTLWELALVGAVLAPTDAALGKTAMSSPRVPALVRHGLNVESGLNDGMVLPFFVLFLAALPGTSAAREGESGVFWRALVLSSVLGFLVGVAGGRLLRSAQARGWVSRTWAQLFVPAVATAAYALGVVVDGSGFIAAWVGGFAFGFALRRFLMRLRETPQGCSSFPRRLLSATRVGAARSWSVRAVPSGQGRLRRRCALSFAHPGQLAPTLDLAGYRAAPPEWHPSAAQRAVGGETR
ncbi:cation:proton antiporter domain-containing protein [Streptomyces sp. NPDC001450]